MDAWDKWTSVVSQNEARKGATYLTRRVLLQGICAASFVRIAGTEGNSSSSKASFTLVNHIHQCGVGWYFREGEVGARHYQQAFSVFYGVQTTLDALHQFPWLTVCFDFDSHAYEAMQAEDSRYVQEHLRPAVSSGRIDIVGGTYSQPYASLIGWQANVRQFTEGCAIVREVLGKSIDSFLTEEIFFHPQVPQLLKLCGFKYASLNIQNNGSLPLLRQAVVKWKGLDGSEIATIPHNPWVIPLWEQDQSFARYLDPVAEGQGVLLSIWVETWAPGLDWGASYLPYVEGMDSLRAKGAKSTGLSEYMKRRCLPGTRLEAQSFTMDDAALMFGWPQNKGLLWETIGGWGYEGDALLKENQRLEHELHAAELLLSVLPDADRSRRLRQLWKTLMKTQNHDCFIVSGYPGEYEHVLTTNLEVTKMMIREVETGLRQLRQELAESVRKAAPNASHVTVLCQNPAAIAVRQPVIIDINPGSEANYSMEGHGERIELQRIEPDPANGRTRVMGIVDLPPCGFKTYDLRTGSTGPSGGAPEVEGIANEYYSVKWEPSSKAFSIFDRRKNKSILFRPFSGDITRVNESWWPAPHVGDSFRAKTFDEVSFASSIAASGPIYSGLAVRGDLLTLKTTEAPAAWVCAGAHLYRGLPRVDIVSELHTYPRLRFLALAECELEAEETQVSRDFPFGEEESRKEQFSALNYVRLSSDGFALLLAHRGTQQFFCERRPGNVLVRNMIARETLKGSYQWSWSLTTGTAFTAAESYRFAEVTKGPIVQKVAGWSPSSQSWVSVSDPALVIYRLSLDLNRLTVWLMNYSDERKQGHLSFTMPVRNCYRTDFAGNRLDEAPSVIDPSRKVVRLTLSPWEMAALDIESDSLGEIRWEK